MDALAVASAAIMWMVHFLLLLFINFDARNRGIVAQYAATIYIFYTLTLLFPFSNHEHFDYVINYIPSAGTLFLGVCADLSVMLAIRWSFPPTGEPLARNPVGTERLGFAILVVVASVALVIDIAMNQELLLLPKELYIASEKVPNLLFFSIPAQLILLGGALYSPFKSRSLKLVISVLAVAATALSVIQGYRGVALMVAIYFLYRKWPRAWPLAPAVLMTVAGELSNPIKYFVGGFFLNDKFDGLAILEYYAEHLEEIFGLSGEQKAIVSNLVIGLHDLSLGEPILELRNLLPFTNALFGNITTTSASRLGELTGAGIGQGTGYSFVLFTAESLLIAPLLLLLITKMMRVMSGTPLTFVSWTIFFSLMRDTPAFWAGELKMTFLLLVVIFLVSNFLRGVFKCAPTAPSAIEVVPETATLSKKQAY
jgi:hypothetical protein